MNCTSLADECEEAFIELKERLATALTLSCPRIDTTFISYTNASKCYIGAVLSHYQNGKDEVSVYFSKTLSKQQRNYCVAKRDLLPIIKGI